AKSRVVAFGEIDRPHATAAELPNDAVRSDAGERLARVSERILEHCSFIEERSRARVSGEQLIDSSPQIPVAAAGLVQPSRTLGRVALECVLEESLDSCPAIRLHVRIHSARDTATRAPCSNRATPPSSMCPARGQSPPASDPRSSAVPRRGSISD